MGLVPRQHHRAPQLVIMLNRLVASQWKKILGRLRRENRETKRANGILKTASAFSHRESITPRAHDLLHQHIQETAWVPGPSASSLTLRIVDSITLRVYRKAVTRLPSVRTLSDNLLIRRDSTSPCRKLFGLRYLYNVACHEP